VVLQLLTAVVIGHSVQGRPLRAYEVGEPASATKVLVVGCIHGNERAGIPVARRLSRTHPSFDLWLLPDLNPDSRARANARGVDLNRDFTAHSQPETRAAEALIRRVQPTITIWFHQHENRVRAWGRSRAVARRFARLAHMSYASVVWPAGAATRWQNGLGETSFVVELPAGPLAPRAVERVARAVLALAS
jgi:murein peptide amidase A